MTRTAPPRMTLRGAATAAGWILAAGLLLAVAGLGLAVHTLCQPPDPRNLRT